MAVALIGMNKKKRSWGDDEQKLLDMMMGYASAHHTRTLDLLGGSNSSQLHVELGREQAIPLGWEKRLDLKSARVYFTNWNTGMTTLDDPREAMHDAAQPAEERGVDLKLQVCLKKNGLEEKSRPECLWLLSSNPISRHSVLNPSSIQVQVQGSNPSSSPSSVAVEDAASDAVFMLTGCKRCLMYVIISPLHPKCPKCGTSLFVDFPPSKKCKVQPCLPSSNKRPSPLNQLHLL